MRHAVVLAGGSGTRLWPLSRREEPKQLIPLAGGKSLLELSLERLEGLVDPARRYVCAGEKHRGRVGSSIHSLPARQYLGEPEGRDTLAAIGFAAAVAGRADPQAVLGVFTSDHIIRPVERFREIVAAGYALVEEQPATIVTFGVAPTYAATSYGYLELAQELGEGARRVGRFREKPDLPTAERFVAAGPERYLWNSGMFVFRVGALLDLLREYEPELAAGLERIERAWGTPGEDRVLRDVYSTFRGVSFDFGVMERASMDSTVRVAALPMPLDWIDIGSWPAFGAILPPDTAGNAASAARHLLEGCSGTLVVSDDPEHLVVALGCQELIIVHAGNATLICPKERAEDVKKLQALVAERFGERYV